MQMFVWLRPEVFLLLVAFNTCWAVPALAQQGGNQRPIGSVQGSFQLDGQYYFQDDEIGTPEVPEDILFNGYGMVSYTLGNFNAGVRYEAYHNPLLGISPDYAGQGIANRYVSYSTDNFEVTAGNFYEQFGTGMVLRAYWEPLLGVDNAFNGFRAKGTILNDAIQLKGIIGRQRYYWDNSPGIVRAGDIEVDFNRLLDSVMTNAVRVRIGGSAVSRYLPDEDPTLELPENVAAFAGRLNLGIGNFNFLGEYAYKVNDPAQYTTLFGNTIYNPGSGVFLSGTWSAKGIGISVQAKRLENMDFRSALDADFSFNEVPINFLPPLARQHTYRLQTLYLYATQPNGEMGLQADLTYTIPRGSALGGKYGTTIAVNYSRLYNLERDTTGLVENLEYEDSEFLTPGNQLYYEDFNIDITRKFSRAFKLTLAYVYMANRLGLQGLGSGVSYTHLGVADMTFRIKRTKSLKVELQHLYTPSDKGIDGQEGSWAAIILEYSIAPHWFFAASNEYNYGNENPDRRLNYYSAVFGYNFGGSRVQFGYARQRQGIICVGGICRVLPASNGFQFSISSTF